MMDIDVGYGIDPWPDDDSELPEPRDERADRQDHNDNVREDYKIANN